METTERKATQEAARAEAGLDKETGKEKKEKTTTAKKEKAVEKGKGVAVWQKGLRPLRDLVNMAQLNAETVKDKTIAGILSKAAKAERVRIEKSETIPARLNRRFLKFCKG